MVFTAVNGLSSGHYTVNVSNGKMNRPFDKTVESSHYGTLSSSGTYLIDYSSTRTEARNIDLTDTRSFKSVRLLAARNPYEGYRMPLSKREQLKPPTERPTCIIGS
ncbi:hypothetical protein JCM10003_52 [Bacteroides pyogenes JCM 10003]|nr:hypothetical protein JCM10003_52 [Bacteroides pyogenes JCM 10003]